MTHVQAADGTRLHSTEAGQGSPVVLIHGWPLYSDMWEYTTGFLVENGCRVITYDRRGFGRSEQPWTGYDYDTMADDLRAVMDAHDVHGATLVGFSMGAGEVARLLGRHGADRVARAVLVAGVTPYLLQDASNPDGVDRSVFDQMVDGLKQDRPSFLAQFAKRFYGTGLLSHSVSSGILEWSMFMALHGSARATIECVRAFSETDFRDDLRGITVPTLIIHGDADQTVPLAKSGQEAARLIPGARLLTYAGAPHGLYYTEKDRLNEDLLAFIRE